MPLNPSHHGSLQFIDYSKEKSGMDFNFGPITALTIAAFLSQFGAFRTATEALSLGNLVSDSWTGDTTTYNVAPPTDENAQRERKWRVRYQDTVNLAIYKIEIPCANIVGQLQAGTDNADLTTAEWVAWIAAFEALAKSPEGNTVNVLDAIKVGRNL